MRLIDKLLEDPDEAIDLCRHNFGHHVVQCVLEHGHARRAGRVNEGHRSYSYYIYTYMLMYIQIEPFIHIIYMYIHIICIYIYMHIYSTYMCYILRSDLSCLYLLT